MAEALSVLDHVDATLDTYEASFGPGAQSEPLDLDDAFYAEASALIDEAWDEEIDVLPTAVDEHDLAIEGLMIAKLPIQVRTVGMPLSALIGQRSL